MGSVLPSSGQAQNGLTPKVKITKDGGETCFQDSWVLGLWPGAPPDISLPAPQFGPHRTYWCWDHHKWLLNDFWKSPYCKNIEAKQRGLTLSRKDSTVQQIFVRLVFRVKPTHLTQPQYDLPIMLLQRIGTGSKFKCKLLQLGRSK